MFILHLALIKINDDKATPILGQNYTLTCDYSEADHQYGTTTYQWSKSSVASQTSGQTLHFSSLRTFDAGQYTCSVTMGSVTLSYDHNITVQSNKVPHNP